MIIKNGTIMDPLTLTHKKADLLIKNGCIEQILPESFDLLTSPEFSQEAVIDADGLIVAPGLIDTHIHFRDPGFTYKEDLHTGALSAAKAELPLSSAWQTLPRL